MGRHHDDYEEEAQSLGFALKVVEALTFACCLAAFGISAVIAYDTWKHRKDVVETAQDIAPDPRVTPSTPDQNGKGHVESPQVARID